MCEKHLITPRMMIADQKQRRQQQNTKPQDTLRYWKTKVDYFLFNGSVQDTVYWYST